MAKLRLVIIGGVAAGSKAAARARRVNPDADIVIYQQEAEVAYSACGEPYALSGIVEDYQQLIIRSSADFVKSGVAVFTQHRVLAIDAVNKKLTVEHLLEQRIFIDDYDALILATGAIPIVPEIDGIQADNVLTLRSWLDFMKFRRYLQHSKPRHAVIIGTGYMALELAETLTQLNIKTTLIGRSEQVLSHFDAEMMRPVAEHLKSYGVNVLFNTQINKILTEQQRATAVLTRAGQLIYADLIVSAVGIKPNVSLATQAGIQLGETGAIRVNPQMMTNINCIYAAGDCCETIHRLTGQAIWQPLGDLANLQGRVAGENAVGGHALFTGCLGSTIVKTFDFNIAMTGLSEKAAHQQGFETISVTVKAANKARYYPNNQISLLKLIAEAKTGKLLGAQAVGRGASDKFIDIIATALLGQLSCTDLENADFAYSPPFSPVLSPVITAAAALNKQVRQSAFNNTQQNSNMR